MMETTMGWPEIILLGVCVALVLCPPQYDPAIRLKEWLVKKERR